jgi:hypothetical protein
MSNLFKNIYNILYSTRLKFIYKDIFVQYNIHLNYIDFILFNDNFILCISQNNNINNFISEIDLISYQLQKKCVGIYLSMFKLTSLEEKLLIDENLKNINHYIYISGNDNKLIKNLLRNLYFLNIYCYYNSGDCIMID